MRYLIAGLALVVLSGCASDPCRGYMEAGFGKERLIYSPYYELEENINGGDLVARLVITLGFERIPQEYRNKNSLTRHCQNGVLPQASEIYFINKSGSEITIEPKNLTVGSHSKLFVNKELIPAGKWFITEPMLELSSVYGEQLKASFEFTFNGEAVKVEGVAKRLSMEEVSRKYQPK